MNWLERIQSLQQRLTTYSPVEVAIELAVIWIVVYVIVRFVQGTRAAGALKGLLIILICVTVLSRLLGGGSGDFQRLALLYDKFLALVAIALIVIFQPELRRALVRLGETSLLRSTPKDIRIIVEEVSDAAAYLSKAKFGALIVIERSTKLGGLVEGGTKLGAELSSRLLQTIFFPGSALHDLACVVKGRVVDSAGVQLPLADPSDMPDRRLGSRHRAAVGLTLECDALVVIVSEETGAVRIAERGRLTKPLSEEELSEQLLSRLTTAATRSQVAGAGPLRGPLSAAPLGVPILEQTAQERRDSHDSMMDTMSAPAMSPSDTLAGSSLGTDALGGSTANGDPAQSGGFASGSAAGDSVAGANADSTAAGRSAIGVGIDDVDGGQEAQRTKR